MEKVIVFNSTIILRICFGKMFLFVKVDVFVNRNALITE